MDAYKPSPTPPDAVRGKITGFSDQAAARLRAFSMENEVFPSLRIAYTLTTRRDSTAAEWRGWINAMNHRFTRKGWAAIWRIELHRRGVPHLHIAAFHHPEEVEAAVRQTKAMWLELTGQDQDTEAKKRAVRWKPISSGGWAVYQALHDGKHKEDQLGWQGKQWGVWNRKVFQTITPEEGELTDDQDTLFRRWFNRLVRARGGRVRCPRSGTFVRMCNPDTVKRLYSWVIQERPQNPF